MSTRSFLSLSFSLAALLAGCGSTVIAEPPGSTGAGGSSTGPSTGAGGLELPPCGGADCSKIARVAQGNPRCAVRESGDAVCWGGAFPGGDYPNDEPPVAVPGLHDVVDAAGLDSQMCFLRVSGHVACMGSNEYGEVGPGAATGDTAVAPVEVPGVQGAVQIVAGLHFTCARQSSGKVLCWGRDDMLGAADPQPPNGPVAVAGLDDAVSLAAGWEHACAARSNGEVVCWGNNLLGVLGNGAPSNDHQQTPVQAQGVSGVVEVSAGWYQSCARRSSGKVVCWGGTNQDPSTPPAPGAVTGIDDAIALSSGNDRTCALRAGGMIACWGSYSSPDGILGPAKTVYVDGPALDIAVGSGQACSALSSGGVECWLGMTPLPVKGL